MSTSINGLLINNPATMVLISVNVFDVCCKKTLLTWTVLETHDDTLTVSTFYETVSEEKRICCSNATTMCICVH